jgi:hypothetical protein
MKKSILSTNVNNSMRLKSNSKSRRRNISTFSSPIAKDQTGNLYYMNCNGKNADLDAISLISTNK